MVKNAKLIISLSEAKERADKIAKTIKGGEVFALIGELGSGKTTFTRALGKALGVKNSITSPTFVIMQQYLTNKKSTTDNRSIHLYHLDLYRTKNFPEVASLGIQEIWGHPETITVIEWADKIYNNLPAQTQYIYLQRDEKL